MDEAEALSTKMGIMVKGGIFKCFGSAQHIKNKFGTGYVIEIKIKSLHEDDLPPVAHAYYPNKTLNLTKCKFDDKIRAYLKKNIDSLDHGSNDLLR